MGSRPQKWDLELVREDAVIIVVFYLFAPLESTFFYSVYQSPRHNQNARMSEAELLESESAGGLARLIDTPEPTKGEMPAGFFTKCPTRLMGLGIAIGEALRFVFSNDIKNICSSVACTYILCHAAYQAFKAHHENAMASAMFDTLIYDGLASALIPSFITYHTSRITFAILKESTTVPDVIITWGPTVMGLFILTLTTESIDQHVREALNDTVRKLY